MKTLGLDDEAALSLVTISGSDAGLRIALQNEDLPVDDLGESGRQFFRIERNGVAVGYGGYELAGNQILLRSLTILPEFKGQGLGVATSRLIVAAARRTSAGDIWLLTQTASAFFAKLGFQPVDRHTAPADILATRQATSLCPSSAVLMRLPR